MNAKRKWVIRNKITHALIPSGIRAKKNAGKTIQAILKQIQDIGVLGEGLIADTEVAMLERQYCDLRAKYTDIKIHYLFTGALGAYIQTFYLASKDGIENDGILHIMLPASLQMAGTAKYPNPMIQEYFDYLFIPNQDNIRMLLYILNYHMKDVDLSQWSRYASGSIEADGSKDAYVDYRDYVAIHYSEEEMNEGTKYLKELGVTGPYVTFRNRVAKGGSLGGVRNGDTSTYYKAVSYLQEYGTQCVYVGLNENDNELGNGIIDASKKYNAKMDLFIHSQAQFFMGDHSGIIAFAQLFNRPMILLNLPYFTMDGDAYGPTFYERDLLLPEKIYDTKNERYLTIKEMLAFEMEYLAYKELVQFYGNNGYEFVKNTEEDILAAVKEMLAKIAGTWQYSEEDLNLQERYLKILNQNARRYQAKWCRAAIGMEFLKSNQWLLD